MRVGAGVLNCGIITSYLIFINVHLTQISDVDVVVPIPLPLIKLRLELCFGVFIQGGISLVNLEAHCLDASFFKLRLVPSPCPILFHCHRFHSCDFKFIFKCYKVPSIVFLINWTPLQNWVSLLKAPPAKRCAPLFNSRVPKLLSRGHDYRGV